MLSKDLALVFIAVFVLLGYAVALPVGSGGGADPVSFDDTLSLGLTSKTMQVVNQQGLSIPHVEAYYSAYEYVIGFNTIQSYLTEQARTGHTRQFGQPVAVFVSDYTGTNVSLTPDGYLTATRHISLVPASDAFVVVNSRARLPNGPVAVPFGDHNAASTFAERYGGSVVRWQNVDKHLDSDASLTRSRFQPHVENRSNWANTTVEAIHSNTNRPESIVVGRNTPTIEAAIKAAPANTTITVPPGTYRTDGLLVDKPVTITGSGPETRIVGDRNGSVIEVSASGATITNLTVTGVGDVGSRRSTLNESQLAEAGWSENVELAYGRGDAAIRLVNASETLLADLTIRTRSSGVVLLNSGDSVLRELNVTVTQDGLDGFMGVIAMYDPIVVEDSRFTGGRDGVYTHRADGIVIRDNHFADSRYGVHEMYTSRSLVQNNIARNTNTGIIIMTGPTENYIVGNDIRESEVGISTAGSHSYFAGNVLTENHRGLDILAYQSLFTHNTITGNNVGVRGGSGIPTNLVTANDIVDNQQPVITRRGSLRVWSVGERGNYWGPVPGLDRDNDGHSERAFRPTGPIDARVDSVSGAWTLAQSPAVEVLRSVENTVPGLRTAGVLDTAPRVRPARPDLLERVQAGENTTEAVT